MPPRKRAAKAKAEDGPAKKKPARRAAAAEAEPASKPASRPRKRAAAAEAPAPPPAKRAAPASAFDEAEATKSAKKLTVPKLRAALEAAGADTKGLKAALVERLVEVKRAAAQEG